MAITDNYTPDKSSGNGVTVAFSGNWNPISSDYFRLYWENKTTGVQTLKTLGTHYTLAFTASGYTATHDVAHIPPSTVWVVRARDVSKDQSVPYKTSTGFQGSVIEQSFDKLTAIDQEMQDNIDRSVKFPLGITVTDPVYGDAPADGYGIIWDGANGRFRNTTVSLADLETEAALLAGIEADIVTVAGIAASVTTVAGIAAAVSNVSSISAAVSNVSGISAAVSNVNVIRANVTTVAGISANVTSVAAVAAAVSTVAGISANVTTVAGVSANVTTVAGNIANVNTVAGISANVTTVAGISGNVTTVAGDRTSIIAVAADLTKIDAVYADLTKIDGVYGDLTKIDGVYGDLTKIDGVYADLANIDAVYAALTNINTVAGISAAVSTVSTNIAAVNTCSTNIAAIIDAPAQATAAAASAAAAAAAAAGISMKSSCRAATTAALTVTYANGTLGVGATLTNAGAQAAFALDGVTLLATERVLIKDQASALQNGIYTVTTVGTGATNWVLTRATDYDTASEIVEGTATIISEGTVNASHIFVMTHNSAITVGTTAIDYTALTANATSANTLTTPRAIYGNNFDGSTALTQVIASTYGGTGNGFTKFSGASASEKTYTLPNASAAILTDNALVTSAQGGTGNGFTKFSGASASEKTYTLPNASCTVLTSNAAVTVAQGGTGLATLTDKSVLVGAGTGNVAFVAPSTSGNVLTSNGTDWTSAASWTLKYLGSVTTTSGATQSITGLGTSNKGYFIILAGVSGSLSSTVIKVALSSDNGSNYGTVRTISGSVAASALVSGQVLIDQTNVTANKQITYFTMTDAGATTAGSVQEATTTGATNAMQFSSTTGAFDAGAIHVYAIQ